MNSLLYGNKTILKVKSCNMTTLSSGFRAGFIQLDLRATGHDDFPYKEA